MNAELIWNNGSENSMETRQCNMGECNTGTVGLWAVGPSGHNAQLAADREYEIEIVIVLR